MVCMCVDGNDEDSLGSCANYIAAFLLNLLLDEFFANEMISNVLMFSSLSWQRIMMHINPTSALMMNDG